MGHKKEKVTKANRQTEREQDQTFQDETDRLIKHILIWRMSAEEEAQTQENIVTISTSEDSDSDIEASAKCRRNQNSRNKTQIMIKKQHEENVKDWGPYIKELGKSVTRDKVSNRALARMVREGSQEIGDRKPNPEDYPNFKESAPLRPETQECHQGDLYQEARQQAKREGPPLYTLVYDANLDHWFKYLTSPEDIIKSLTNQIELRAERAAMKAKIEMIQTQTKAFREVTHREEMESGKWQETRGEKTGRLALKTIRKWKEELDQYKTRKEALANQKREGRVWREKEKKEKKEKPGPNTKCHGCKAIPDARLRQCGRCHNAYYCHVECQKKAWREHRIQCRLDGPQSKKDTWPI